MTTTTMGNKIDVADAAALAAKKAAYLKYETVDCTRCGGTGGTAHLHVMLGECFKCGGTGRQLSRKDASSYARDVRDIEIRRLRSCWVAVRDEIRAREALPALTWAQRYSLKQLQVTLDRYEAAGKALTAT